MLNSNFFSRRQFQLNITGFNLWLQQQYGIVFSNSDLDAQINYFSKYISFINYREKYIKEQINTPIPLLTKNQSSALKELLQQQNISFINR